MGKIEKINEYKSGKNVNEKIEKKALKERLGKERLEKLRLMIKVVDKK